jgi:hypothetical protein
MAERFYVDTDDYSYCVRDREILYTLGASCGEPRVVQWCSSKEKAEQVAKELNATRGHASDEPKCVRCGAQPAGPVGSEQPMCASCHSILSRGD